MTIDKTPIQNGSIAFRPRARLIRLLGDELISDEIVALVELVKNSYDADAYHVTVNLDNVTSPNQGLISIRDDGCGMDIHNLLHAWMEPAASSKRRQKGGRTKSTLGRVQLGEKGVGRFAADKIGAELELVTRCAGAEEELVLKVSWHHFDHDQYLDEVENVWFSRKPLEFTGENHGTLLLIRSLRIAWNQEMVTKLNNGLVRLVSPATGGMDFTVEVICPEFPFANGPVVNRVLETAPYRLSGHVDAEGNLHVTNSPEHVVDLRLGCHNYFLSPAGDLRLPCCGPFSVSLNVWDLELSSGKGLGTERVPREAIKSFSGVSIYRDGFRIWPYGEKDEDWLELNQRRVNNPTLRISNNQIIGFVEITHLDNPDLLDRTSREGLLDTPAFFDLKTLVLAALSELETIRFSHRRQLIQMQSVPETEEGDKLLLLLSQLRNDTSQPDKGKHTRRALQDIEHLYRARLEQEQTRYNQVSRLAGTGMAAELLTEAFSKEINFSTTILRTLQGEVGSTGLLQLQNLVESLSVHIKAVNEQLDMMGPLYRSSFQENEPVNIYGVAYDVISILTHQLTTMGVKVTFMGDKSLTVRLNRGHIMQVIMILVENALMAMKEATTENPAIEIQVHAEKSFKGLRIADTGPGVSLAHHKLIFEPYFSARKAGRGLGLNVARDILRGYNSYLELVSDKSSLPGACFEIRLDGRRVMSQNNTK